MAVPEVFDHLLPFLYEWGHDRDVNRPLGATEDSVICIFILCHNLAAALRAQRSVIGPQILKDRDMNATGLAGESAKAIT